MFIDTSALIAILTSAPERDEFANAIEKSPVKITSGLVKLETVIAMTRFDLASPQGNSDALDLFLARAEIQCFPIDETVSELAIQAFIKYGRGSRQGAGLNLSDCMSYAMARHYKLPLLCKGNDFPKTDIALVKLPGKLK